MNTVAIEAHDYLLGRPLTLRIPEVHRPAPGRHWVAPPLFDLQINGYGGVDFQTDELPPELLRTAVRALRRDGCGQFLFTLITDRWENLLRRLEQARRWREASVELRAAMAGWHVEGPFLSEKPGYCGAHNPALMCDPTPAHMEELRSVTGGDPVLVTLAPERPGALAAIRRARELGLIVSLGHTDASADNLKQAVAAGASAFTHLGNGCPRELDRHDNILWRVAEENGLGASFIPDGIHVSPAPFRLLHRLLGPDRLIYYTTDAMAASGAGPGKYRLGSLEVEVGTDQVVRQPGRTNFAGSALSPIDGVFRAARMLGVPWNECWRRFSETPARLLGRSHSLQTVREVCLLTLDEGELPVSAVLVPAKFG